MTGIYLKVERGRERERERETEEERGRRERKRDPRASILLTIGTNAI